MLSARAIANWLVAFVGSLQFVSAASPNVELRELSLASTDVGPGVLVFSGLDCNGAFKKIPFSPEGFGVCTVNGDDSLFSDGTPVFDEANGAQRIHSLLIPDSAAIANSDGYVQRVMWFVDCKGTWLYGEASKPGCYNYAPRNIKFSMVPSDTPLTRQEAGLAPQ